MSDDYIHGVRGDLVREQRYLDAMTTTSDLRLPRTEAGRRLLSDLDGEQVDREAILAIEDEAATPTDTGLDDAWKEAEAALPEGWEVRLSYVKGTVWFAMAGDDSSAWAVEAQDYTPAAALQELASRLSGPHDGEEGAAE